MVLIAVFTSTAANAEENRIAIKMPKGTTLEQSAEGLARSVAGVVVLTPPNEPLSLEMDFQGTPDEFAAQITKQFALHAVRRPGLWAFRRGYRSPREPMELELGKIQRSAEGISRLLSSLEIDSDTLSHLKEKVAFAQAISTEQRASMAAEGLLFGDLKPDQQHAFRRLCSIHAYSPLKMEALRFGEVFRNWNQSQLTLRHLEKGEPVYTLQFGNNADDRTGRAVAISPATDLSPNVVSFASANPTALPSVAHARLLQKRVLLPVRTSSLVELVRTISSRSKLEIKVPAYAEGRRILCAAANAQVGDVLQAIQDLYGWDRRPLKGGGYELLLAHPSGIRDPDDLIRKINSLVPAPLARVLAEGEVMKSTRQLLTLRRVLVHLDGRFPNGWERTSLTELPKDLQDSAAQVFGLEMLSEAIETWRKRSEAPIWLTNPELGMFRWKGSTPNSGLLSFEVRRSGRSVGWGWVVGSSSLEKPKN